eukprot:8226081-Lingulodinium_polyedra.AAC.1
MEGPRHLKRVELDLARFYWTEVVRPGYFRNIALEEWSAFNWSLEERLHRPSELGHRVLHIGDNA